MPKSTILHGTAEIRQNFDHVSIATHASRRAQKKSIKKARFTLILAQVTASGGPVFLLFYEALQADSQKELDRLFTHARTRRRPVTKLNSSVPF